MRGLGKDPVPSSPSDPARHSPSPPPCVPPHLGVVEPGYGSTCSGKTLCFLLIMVGMIVPTLQMRKQAQKWEATSLCVHGW